MSTPTRRTRKDKNANPTLGIHLDGTDAYAVLLKHGEVVETHHIKAPTPQDQIRELTAKTGNPTRIRIAYTHPQDQTSAFILTKHHTNYTHLAQDAQKTLPPATSDKTYALQTNPKNQHHQTAPADLTATPTNPLHDLYKTTPNPQLQITHPALVSADLEGAHLAIYHTHTTVTFTKDNTVKAHAVLKTPGLSQLAQTLGPTPQGTPRLPDLLTGPAQNPHDPDGADQVNRYLRRLVSETHNTLEHWRRNGHQIPDSIYCHGPGATTPQLAPLLKQHHIEQNTDGPANQITNLPTNQRAQYVYAYLAAKTYSTRHPETCYPNPHLVKQITEKQETNQRKTRKTNLLLAAAVVTTFATAPAIAAVTNIQESQRVKTALEEYADTLHIPLDLATNPPPDPETLTPLTTLKTGELTQLTALPGAIHLTYKTTQPQKTLEELTPHLTATQTSYDHTNHTLSITGTPVTHAINPTPGTN